MKRPEPIHRTLTVAGLILAVALFCWAQPQHPGPTPAATESTTVDGATGSDMSDVDKVCYALGYVLAADYTRRVKEFNPAMFSNGFDDAVRGTEPRLPEAQMRAIVTQIRIGTMLNQMRQQPGFTERANRNATRSRAFIERMKKKQSVMATESGLLYETLVTGDGPRPNPDSTVRLHYHGKLADGTTFDNSRNAGGEPAEFVVGGLMKGWAEGLLLMPAGSTWRLYIPPELGHGELGLPGTIPPNMVLIFVVELLEVR